jgi:hypothetical protein
VAWLATTLQQLQTHDLANIDWEHLIEEVEDLGREQRRQVESYLIQLLKHLLLYQYWEAQKTYCANSWADEIDIFHIELEILLRSRTLHNYACNILAATYQKAERLAKRKSGLTNFPDRCPYSMAQVLDFDGWPE